MPSSLYVPFLLGGMILTGSSNSLWSKWQDMQCVENCLDPDPANRVLYEQPVWQTLQMFLGEMLCFLPVLYTWLAARHQSSSVQLPNGSEHNPQDDIKLGTPSEDLSGWKFLLLWIPAICDLTGTTLMNVGLLYTPVSIYQMTRGALVLFVGIFSVIFLRRRLWLYQWVSLIIVMTGVGLVGWSGSLIKAAVKEAMFPSLTAGITSDLPPSEEPDATRVLVGVFFILFAQVFTATQFVVEEKIMERYSVTPLVAVGFEGLFGALSIILLFPIMSIPSVSRMTPFFDLPRGWHQMVDNSAVLYSGIAIACSIAFFNYFGLSVTRHFLFNNLISTPSCLPGPPPATSPIRITDEEDNEADALLSSSVLDETAALPADLGQSGFDVIPEGHHLKQPQPHPAPQTQA
ncbi:hypothetical protein H0H92_011514 [Tricholoma furcatifolium]|nr:hypothetical protein H0H92_011514 [Tricholoma furcatifolium]